MPVECRPGLAAAGDNGFVLLSVLSVTALLALILGGAMLLSRATIDTSRLTDSTLRKNALLQSGLELAGHQLFVLRTDPAALGAQQLRLDSGTVTISVSSEAGRVDLNSADELLLAAAARAANLTDLTPAEFAARVIDWRDSDDDARADGAEAEAYRAAGSTYTPPNSPFRSVGDLRYLLGITAADVSSLSAYVTISNPAGKIDPMYAPTALLEALPGVSPSALAALADARNRSGLDRLFHMRAIFRGLEAHVVLGEMLRAFAVHLEVRLDGIVATGMVDAVLIAPVLSDRPFQVTQWVQH
ncbi:general secretion pathway protein GspK [Aureimonas sp. AU40]|uniref:general secretion pathway protein GspK n=1 Tax=Aureimonas sp. AU40 TaxID=1637747 RepID=UPI000AF4C56F|nr:type II secretion system protein GspK [Aureimonas sp. AU40]